VSNLSDLLGGAAGATGWEGSKDKDRFLEPCFYTMGQENGTGWGGTMCYDHNLNLAAVAKRGDSYNGGFMMINDWGGSEMGEQRYWAAQTQSTVDSSSHDRGAGTSAQGLLGHRGITVANDGTFTYKFTDKVSQRNVGTWLHNSTPDLAIFNDNSENYVASRSYNISSNNHTRGNAYGGFWNARGCNSEARYGTQSYNEQTKKFCMLESDGNYNYRINVWSNVESPAKFNNSKDFYSTSNFNDATRVQSDWCSVKPTNQSEEDNYRATVVMTDTGDVVVSKMIPHWGFFTVKFVADAVDVTSYTVPTDYEWAHSWTTTYGMEQGNDFGIRHNVSMDGKYIWAYCPAYYYGAGYILTITRVSDGKMLHHYDDDSTYGAQFIPWRDDKMLFGRSINADGDEGMYIWTVDLKEIFIQYENNTQQWGIGDFRLYRTIDTVGHSTNYPFIGQMMNQDMYKFIGQDEEKIIEHVDTMSATTI
jgi:hypothetical protein